VIFSVEKIIALTTTTTTTTTVKVSTNETNLLSSSEK
jgi:hypothetical protein